MITGQTAVGEAAGACALPSGAVASSGFDRGCGTRYSDQAQGGHKIVSIAARRGDAHDSRDDNVAKHILKRTSIGDERDTHQVAFK